MKKFGFTLAEIMIVLSVIAIITAILLPSARNAMPDKNLMKFKKGHQVLLTAISELVNSDSYYLDGDLGLKPDGTLVNCDMGEENCSYLCKTFADMIPTKYVNCITEDTNLGAASNFISGCPYSNSMDIFQNCNGLYSITQEDFLKKKQNMDKRCKQALGTEYYKQIITTDGIYFWDNNPSGSIGQTYYDNGAGGRLTDLKDKDGFSVKYKYFCMDIDGVPDGATADDCINECPFGYGIRFDGKVMNGQRADEWMNKSIQNKD